MERNAKRIRMPMLKYALLALVFSAISACDGGTIVDQVADDAVDGYNLAVKGEDKIEICVHAGMVVAAYNQAKNEDKYLEWKKIERRDCAAAGMPK